MLLSFCSVPQEAFDQLIRHFAPLLLYLSQRSSSTLDLIENLIWPSGGHLEFSFPLNISRTIWTIDVKCSHLLLTIRKSLGLILAPIKILITWPTGGHLEFSFQYLKKCLSNWVEILHIYWYILDKVQIRSRAWSYI